MKTNDLPIKIGGSVMKKIVSFVLVLMLLLTAALPALADDPMVPRRGRYSERSFQLKNTQFTYVEEDKDINESNDKVNFDTIDLYTLKSYDGYVDLAYRMFFSLDRGAAMNMVVTVEMCTPNGTYYIENSTIEMTYKRASSWRYAFYIDALLERCDYDGNLTYGEYNFRMFIDGYLVNEASFYVLP